MFFFKQKLSFHVSNCTVVATAQQDSVFDHLCQEDFQYMKSVKPFCRTIDTDTTIGSKGGNKSEHPQWTQGNYTPSWTPQIYPKF
jgi:hypothetical protein